ncbi:Mitogen-activated protein kinase 15 [Galemys pyrenaicus]|uniref:Mitogen-activated protein kinase 15 n=1 Tax=Galemys pyrenaicus TaxID=202257 RepID=A0A8J6ADW8_GALPY|nr:Mitogen-activated protein kinase 15 [Galemys pyrenaicus]
MCAAEVDWHVAQRYLLKRRLGKGGRSAEPGSLLRQGLQGPEQAVPVCRGQLGQAAGRGQLGPRQTELPGPQAYGIVWKAVDRRTGEVVAIKKIFDAFRDRTDAQRTFREVALLREFGDHPNIIRLLDVIRAENDRDIYLVLESMGGRPCPAPSEGTNIGPRGPIPEAPGSPLQERYSPLSAHVTERTQQDTKHRPACPADTDLAAVIRKGGLLKDVHRRYIFYQLLRATKFIHSGGVVHRDQKPSNVLLNASCLVKLCDFGLARSLRGPPEGPDCQALTEYVATRWYRAPEVLLSCSWYSPAVDMWGLGCVLGEMLRGRPLFPGTSSLHQLELILDTIPPPSKEDLLALGAGPSASVLQHLGSRPRHTLDALLPLDTPPEALDLLQRLLVFAPGERLTAAEALQHPYVQRFHCPAREWSLEADVRLPVHEAAQLSAPEYRSCLYQMILEHREKGLGGAPKGSEPRACAHPLKPRAAPQPLRGTPAQHRGHKPQSGLGHQPEHEVTRGAKNVPRYNLAPQLQPPPPAGPGEADDVALGATAEAPLEVHAGVGRGRAAPALALPAPVPQRPCDAAPGEAPREGPAPSLTSQAACEVTNQALMRKPRGSAGRRASPSPRRPVTATPNVLTGPPGQQAPELRPGRRMFGAWASQSAQGAARAVLGGYSQAYSTVSCSTLGRLALRPEPARELPTAPGAPAAPVEPGLPAPRAGI